MGKSNVVLIAGLLTEMQLENDTWQRVPRLTQIGDTGEQSERKEKTTLEDESKKYDSGLRDLPEKNFMGQYIPFQESGDEHYDDYVLQQAFIERCRNEEEFNVRITWKGGENAGFSWKSLGWQLNGESQDGWLMFTANGSQNSRAVWNTTVSGTASVLETETTQLTVAVTPSNIALNDYEDAIVWSSSDEAVVTVDQDGLVTGVAAGVVTITAEVRGIAGTLEVTVTA